MSRIQDQIDWHVKRGLPDERLPNVTIDGSYLIATAVASPSDEAQLTSCAIACASSPIRVRARQAAQKWTTSSLELQTLATEVAAASVSAREFPGKCQLQSTPQLSRSGCRDLMF